jgi:hypothetical protein
MAKSYYTSIGYTKAQLPQQVQQSLPAVRKKREKKPPNFPARDPAAAHAALAAHWLSYLKTISF